MFRLLSAAPHDVHVVEPTVVILYVLPISKSAGATVAKKSGFSTEPVITVSPVANLSHR